LSHRSEAAKSLGKYAKYGSKFDRAMKTAFAGGVKEHRFLPSGRAIDTVVGQLGDEFVDVSKPYCSCGDFFFRVLSGREELCYHLLSYKIASDLGRLEVIVFDDVEYGQVLAMIVDDVFGVIDRSSRTQSLRLA